MTHGNMIEYHLATPRFCNDVTHTNSVSARCHTLEGLKSMLSGADVFHVLLTIYYFNQTMLNIFN